MVAYKTRNPETNKKVFVYVSLNEDDDKAKITDFMMYEPMLGRKGIHLTTNHAWERYIAKRKETPRFVRIFQTQEELDCKLNEYGFLLT